MADLQDTPRGNDVIGTLVLVLPNEFEGGELVIKEGERDDSVKFSWPERTR